MGSKTIAILGAGGFGREVAEFIEDINRTKPTWDHIGFLDDDVSLTGKDLEGIPVWGTTESIMNLPANTDVICAIGNPFIKKKAIEKILEFGFNFTNIIHPSSYIGKHVRLGQGIIIGPHCVVTKNVVIGNHVSINPQCGIGHDVYIDDYTTLYWNVNISGNVQIGKVCELGTKATILQGLSVGEGTKIGANAVVTKSLNEYVVAAGVPAKYLRNNTF